MRPCPALRGSSAITTRTCPPQLQCRRRYTSKAPKDHNNGDQASSNNSSRSSRNNGHRQPPPPTNDDNDSDNNFFDWEKAFRIDQDAKTVETAMGSLPLSPVMDPSFWAQREQYTRRKPKRSTKTTASAPKSAALFERQFAANAFAQALATPIRYESLVRSRLPSFFLQDFHLVTHPETGQPWWIPRSLALNSNDDNKNNNKNKEEQDGSSQSSALGEEEQASTTQKKQKKKPSEGKKLLGPNAYAPARKDVLAAMSQNTNSGFHQHPRLLFGPSSSQYKTFGSKAVWRQDMDELVLGLMRQHVEQDLLYLSRLCVEQDRYYIVKCFGWGDVQYKHKGAVLWFGGSPAEEGGEGADLRKKETSPGPFATFEFSDSEGAKTAVAVHNMPMLLGEETAARIRKEAGALQDGSIFMLAGRRTADLQLKLWKLQGYLSDYK